MASFDIRVNRTIRSEFRALDAKAWLMTAGLTAALPACSVFGFLIQDTELEWVSPYIDPIVLALVCLVVIPVPAGTVKQALADILLVTPSDLKQHVDKIAQEVVRRYGFVSYRAYVARVGPRQADRALLHRPDRLAAQEAGRVGPDPRRDRRSRR